MIVQLDAGAYQRILGEELRGLRERRGLTRRDLRHRLQSDLSLQTIATYELGTRQCSVVRLVELCLALDETPDRLLERVAERYFAGAATPGRIRVDLRKVVQADHHDLVPFQRWAAGKLAEGDGARPGEVNLDIGALERLAELCGLETAELIARIRAISEPAG